MSGFYQRDTNATGYSSGCIIKRSKYRSAYFLHILGVNASVRHTVVSIFHTVLYALYIWKYLEGNTTI